MKQEAPANMEHKVKETSRKITKLCAAWYETATPEQQTELMTMLDDLENAMVAYRQYDMPWDSILIDVVEKIGDRRVKAKAFSTTESVMDKVRNLVAYLGTQTQKEIR